MYGEWLSYSLSDRSQFCLTNCITLHKPDYTTYFNLPIIRFTMRKNYVLLGLALALGVYLYEVLTNLYDKTSFAEALTAVNWSRILFIGLFGALVVRFWPNRWS